MSTIVPVLPPAPVRGAPEDDYIETADAFAAALNPYGQVLQAVGEEVEANAAAAAASEAEAADRAAAAAASAVTAAAASSAGAPMWVAGNYTTGQVAWSPDSGITYRRRSPGGASPTDPAQDPTNWDVAVVAAALYIPEAGATVTARINAEHGLQNAGQSELVMPDPSLLVVGQVVGLAVENGRVDNLVTLTGGAKFNGETQPDDQLLIDDPFARLLFRWTGATYGWSA